VSFSAKYLLRKVLAKDKTTGPSKKAIIPETLNPGTMTDANQKQIPFTTRENAPRVKKFNGRDSAERVGLTELLIKPMTTAAIKAEGKLAISTPGTIKSTISKLNAVASAIKNVPDIVST
jgi:hypothetical protein